MNRNALCAVAAALACAATAACGGKTDGITPVHDEGSTLATLEQGAILERAYVGVDDHMPVGGMPVVATMGLLGGSQLELEVVTPDASPVRFEVWRVRADGTATLEIPVDAPSGFALENIAPDEDGTWVLRFPATAPGDVIVHADCTGGLHGCAQLLQPGEHCPAGWQCDQGLTCELPIGACGPLAGTGTCVDIVSVCDQTSPPGEVAGSVCGCDGREYASECEARLAGAYILNAGACGGRGG